MNELKYIHSNCITWANILMFDIRIFFWKQNIKFRFQNTIQNKKIFCFQKHDKLGLGLQTYTKHGKNYERWARAGIEP